MKNSLLIVSFAVSLVSLNLIAQVGVGTDNPSSSAVLHLQSSNKGLIIPTLTTAEVDAMTLGPISNGTMVFNIDSNEVYVYFGTKWHSLTPLEKEHGQAAPNKGRIKATTNALEVKSLDATTVNTFNGNGITPIGGIIMWSGTTIPSGWALCNGQTANGHPTPNLTGKFIVGYNSSDTRFDQTGFYSQHALYKAGGGIATPVYSAGDFGGQDSVTLDINTIPPHSHNGNTNSDGNHTHSYRRCGGWAEAGGSYWDNLARISNLLTETTTGTGAHSHFFTTNVGGGHGKAHNNLPPYYTLAFIMRVQ
ncbi:MAG: tail fiber protein [Flavobacteriales bacterium]|nr:tail fiber protein [Flavobacteriales bacterium]